jgi:cytochrome bd ubiquinol oxidase subunit II
MNGDAAFVLPIVWALLIGAAVALYVVLDGFDLGIGILFPLFRDEAERDLMMQSIAPYWDGNETWLVLGGVALWVAFPLAYAAVLPALYLPLILMLLALILRGVAVEFRGITKPHHRQWDWSFTLGSTLAAFSQGVVLGGVLQGIPMRDGRYAGQAFDWLAPFALMCGCALVAGYALLGATWLVLKTEGPVAERAARLARPLLLALLGFIAVVSIWTPLQFERIAARWFSLPNFFWLLPLPAATAFAAWLCWSGLRRHKPMQPFVAVIALFLLAYIGLLVSNAPYLVPGSLTIWQAASPPATQTFMLIGTAVLLPITLGYTAFVFWLFRGKVRPGDTYHH